MKKNASYPDIVHETLRISNKIVIILKCFVDYLVTSSIYMRSWARELIWHGNCTPGCIYAPAWSERVLKMLNQF